MTMTTTTTTETLARAETALEVARYYDPTVRNFTDAIGYWTGRHHRHLAEAGRLLGPMNGPAVDEAQAAAYQDLLAIDTELLRALKQIVNRWPADPRDPPVETTEMRMRRIANILGRGRPGA